MAGGKAAAPADLKIRAISALVMLAVSGTALWLGGLLWLGFVVLVAWGVWFEWSVLVMLIHPPGLRRLASRFAGAVYCAIGGTVLIVLRNQDDGAFPVLLLVGAVIATDVGAYFAGRLIGGPKIAPKISPSKTWAGLLGGMALAAVLMPGAVVLLGKAGVALVPGQEERGLSMAVLMACALAGALLAVIAQTGDFFESWMKRRAGVKDSGDLIPGHGGLFDRLDGLLAVLFVYGLFAGGLIGAALLAGESLLPSPA